MVSGSYGYVLGYHDVCHRSHYQRNAAKASDHDEVGDRAYGADRDCAAVTRGALPRAVPFTTPLPFTFLITAAILTALFTMMSIFLVLMVMMLVFTISVPVFFSIP